MKVVAVSIVIATKSIFVFVGAILPNALPVAIFFGTQVFVLKPDCSQIARSEERIRTIGESGTELSQTLPTLIFKKKKWLKAQVVLNINFEHL